jgi:hypothetical protein
VSAPTIHALTARQYRMLHHALFAFGGDGRERSWNDWTYVGEPDLDAIALERMGYFERHPDAKYTGCWRATAAARTRLLNPLALLDAPPANPEPER